MSSLAESLFSVHGRVAVVTGATSGIGAEFARCLALGGAKVAAAGRRLDRLQNLAGEVDGILAVECDVAAEDSLQGLIDTTRSKLGPIDILVNTAGIVGEVRPAQLDSRESFESTLAVNLTAPLRLAALAYPDMKAAGSGSIINIASISGIVGIGKLPQAAYVASKSGLVGLTRELALQWARDGIRVNAIAPGYFQTEMTAAMYEVPKLAEWVELNTPLRRSGLPVDLTGALLLLASDAGAFITGQTIVVDGGWTSR